MIIALGMFVDNAIVVSDDIKVNLESGMDRKEAVSKTGGSLALPLLTSTLLPLLMKTLLIEKHHLQVFDLILLNISSGR